MLRDFLKAELQRKISRNPSYSMRSFAKKLDLHAATLSSVLSGKRPIGSKLAAKLINRMDLDPIQRKRLFQSYLGEKEATQRQTKLLDKTVIEMMGSWEHDAILCVLQIEDFIGDVPSISTRLNIEPSITAEALRRLELLGLVVKDGKTYKTLDTQFESLTDVPQGALRRLHRQYLEKAAYSLRHHSVLERDITGTTLTISKDRLPMAKKMIREFRRELTDFLEGGKKEAVYRLGIQLYPIKR